MVGGLIADLPRQRWGELLIRLAALEVQARWRKLAHALGWRKGSGVDEADLTIPDSALCLAATEWVRSVSPEFLVNHSLRTYVFGCALARRDRLRYDRELFFLAAIMHDLGLTEAGAGPRAFEVEGADRAHQFLVERDYRQAHAVHHAIALHARVGLAVGHSREGAMLQAGAGLDVIGLRAEDLTRAARQRVVGLWPRLDCKRQLAELFGAEARCKPHCNIAAHVDWGFLRRIRQAPFLD